MFLKIKNKKLFLIIKLLRIFLLTSKILFLPSPIKLASRSQSLFSEIV